MRWIKKPFLRVLFCIGAVILSIALTIGSFLGVLWGWDAIDNLHEKHIAKTVIDPKAEAYIAAQYPDNDFIVEGAYHAWYDNVYRVKVHSRSSPDTYFRLTYDSYTYELEQDSYESQVVRKWNTWDRIVKEYQELAEESLAEVRCLHNLTGDFISYSEKASLSSYSTPDGLDESTLILDHDYDVAAMGADYGYLIITVLEDEENVNIEGALEILTQIDKELTQDGVGYSFINLTLQCGEYPFIKKELRIFHITPEDLHCDDPLERLEQLWNEQESES